MGAIRKGVQIPTIRRIAGVRKALDTNGGVCGDRGANPTDFAGKDSKSSVKSAVIGTALDTFNCRERWHIDAETLQKALDIGMIARDAYANAVGIVKYLTMKLKSPGEAVNCRAKAHALNRATDTYLFLLNPKCFQYRLFRPQNVRSEYCEWINLRFRTCILQMNISINLCR